MGKYKGKSSSSSSSSSSNSFKPLSICVALLAALFYYISTKSALIDRIDLSDSLALKEYFFGEGHGGSYVILCRPDEDERLGKKLPQSFADASKIVERKDATFATVDCGEPLPSGASVTERFGLKVGKGKGKGKGIGKGLPSPIVFVAGSKVSKPVQIPPKSLKTGYSLAKVARSILAVKAAKIESTNQLRDRCLSKPYCGLLLKGAKLTPGVKEAYKGLIDEHPLVQFASVDSSLLEMNLEKKMSEFTAGKHRFLMFKRAYGDEDEEGEEGGEDEWEEEEGEGEGEGEGEAVEKIEKITTSAKSYKSTDFTFEGLSAFVEGVVKGEVEGKVLKVRKGAGIGILKVVIWELKAWS